MTEAQALLAKLVSIPSVNPMGRPISDDICHEARLTAFLEDWLRPLDLELHRQPVAPERHNLLATWHAPDARRRVMLEVHQDTIPVDGMTVPAFGGLVESGRFYGRGACDNKGPMTAMLLALRRLARERPKGAASVTLALSVDEEFTFLGVQEMVRRGLGVAEAVVAEPTDLDVVIAHKGVVRWEATTSGRACHSSDPSRGINAIYRMARVVGALERYAENLANAPSHPILGRAALSVGTIDGGVAVNIVPPSCRISIDRRLLPGETPDGAANAVVEYLAHDAGLDVAVAHEAPWLRMPPMGAEINGELAERLAGAIRRHGHSATLKGAAYGTDASPISEAGVPAVVFGPGSIAQAHTADEWIEIDQVERAVNMYFDYCVQAGSA